MCNNNKDLYTCLYDYLVNKSNNIRLNRENDSLIGANLEKIMKTFSISNVMLAKHLNKDGSLISKYKTGKRYILKNDYLIIEMCDFFENYIIKNNLFDEAFTLFNTKEISKLKEDIFKYLFTEQKENSQVNSLLENINNFKFDLSKNFSSVESLVSNDSINYKNNYYIGIKEFRNSVKIFLEQVSLSETPTTLYLYSDENMKWLLQNKEFYNTWKILMTNCLIKKNKIKIIHNIHRNTNEMFKAIESWLPLYMTGLIEPYYNNKNNNNFTHTLFIADKISVISSSSIICNKDCNIYNYSENKDVINNYKKQYLELLGNSNNLIKIYTRNDIIKKLNSKNEYHEYINKELKNIKLLLKNDESEALILKTDDPKILFEFTCSKMINSFKNYINYL